MKQPKISVIVPVYKTEPFLRRCLDSIAGQTYKNLEIILVDDGSPDNCGAICDEYAAKDERFVVLHLVNGGVSSARNAALKIATGEWIGFVDSDDWVEPDMYEYLYEKGSTNSVDVVQCGLFLDDQDESSAIFCCEESVVLGSAAQYSNSNLKCIAPSVCCKLYRAQCLKDTVYEPTCIFGEDFLFNIQVLNKASGLMLCDSAKYHYVQNEASICHAPVSVNVVRSQREAFKSMAKIFDKGSPIHTFLEVERFKLDMHNCSRIAQYPHWDISCMKKEIRSDLRRETIHIQSIRALSSKERGKLFLIGWAWWLYRILLLQSKK